MQTLKYFLYLTISIFSILILTNNLYAEPIIINFNDGIEGMPINNFYLDKNSLFENAKWFYYKGEHAADSDGLDICSIQNGTAIPLSEPIVITFQIPVDIVSIKAVDVGELGAQIDAYDSIAGGGLLSSAYVYGSGAGIDNIKTLSVSYRGIYRIELYQPNRTNLTQGDGVRFDDLRVAADILQPSVISYPESDGDGKFTICWSSVTDALNYTLQRDISSSFDNPLTIYTGQDIIYNEINLEYGTYWYRIKASNWCCDSNWTSGSHPIRLSPACEGDFDLDGDVDGSDLAVFAADFGRTDCGSGSVCEGNLDDDDDVDGSDLAVFVIDFGRTDCP